MLELELDDTLQVLAPCILELEVDDILVQAPCMLVLDDQNGGDWGGVLL